MMPLQPPELRTRPFEAHRIERARTAQNYEPDPPRCGTCVYFHLGTHRQRRLEARKGRGIAHLQRCTFGNFHTTHLAVCDEWHGSDGARIEAQEPDR